MYDTVNAETALVLMQVFGSIGQLVLIYIAN